MLRSLEEAFETHAPIVRGRLLAPFPWLTPEMLNSLPRQCRVRVSCIIFHGHSFLCSARTYRLWPPPLHETKIPLHRTTVVKMISPASRDAGRPPSYSYPLFLPAETPRFIGWIPPRIGKLLADPARDLIVINRYYCSGRRQHFYTRSFGLCCAVVPLSRQNLAG